MQTANNTIIALDVGQRRIGVAVADSIARIPRPLTTLIHTTSVWDDLQQLFSAENADLLIVGLPRGMEGQDTEQTKTVEAFTEELKKNTDLPIRFQDEALTSVKAEEELRARKKPFEKADIDALAAVYILEDYLSTSRN
jgi:putative holliday junction resolvase